MWFSPQIPLQLEPRPHSRFDDFVVGANTSAFEAVRALPGGPDTAVYLFGPESVGKTHLLNAACLAAREAGLTAFYLGLKRRPAPEPDALAGLESIDLVCLDDLHRVAGHHDWEEGLFHFINRLRERRGRLLVASRERLSALPLELPDLASRLAWGLRQELQALDDDGKKEAMQRRAGSLGIELPDDVAAYLLRHSPRNLSRLVDLVERLRHVAFTEKRRITVPLARRVLESG